MQRKYVLLCLALDYHEPHRWSLDCFTDRLGVARVVLIRLHVRPHKAWTHQLHFVPVFRNLAGEMVRATAGFHPDQERFQLRNER